MLKQRIRNSIIGFIIGDVLGVPFEFRNSGSFHCKNYSEFGTHNQRKGTWSDDTSLMLTYLDSKNDLTLNKENLKNWLYKGKYCCDDSLFDIGHSTKKAILSDFKTESDINNNGNGGLLRIWSMVFEEVNYNKVVSFSKLTHNHDINFKYSYFFITFMKRLADTNKLPALAQTEMDLSIKINKDNFSNGGYIVDTVESSINWFLKFDSYKDCVLGAINGGNDTDSVGALVGALSGYYYNKINIPNKIRNFSKIIGMINNYIKTINVIQPTENTRNIKNNRL